jgi:hypothetical protein
MAHKKGYTFDELNPGTITGKSGSSGTETQNNHHWGTE